MSTTSDALGREYDERPWGSYTVLEDAEPEGFKVKRITGSPGQRLSYQRHARRSEHGVVGAYTSTYELDGILPHLNYPCPGRERTGAWLPGDRGQTAVY